MLARPDIDHLLGVPFVLGGRDWRTGLDCHGLVLAAGRVWGVDLPDVWEQVAAEYGVHGAVQLVDAPAGAERVAALADVRRGDVVAVRSTSSLAVSHVVAAEGDGWCLTTARGSVSRREQLRRFAARVHAIWRFPCCG